MVIRQVADRVVRRLAEKKLALAANWMRCSRHVIFVDVSPPHRRFCYIVMKYLTDTNIDDLRNWTQQLSEHGCAEAN